MKVNHFEVFNDYTKIVTCRVCPLQEEEMLDNLAINDNPCCVNGDNFCKHYYSACVSDNSKMYIQCDMLCASYTDRKELIPLDVSPTNAYCPHCNTMLVPSQVEGYTWQCFECDEDFGDFEVNKKEK